MKLLDTWQWQIHTSYAHAQGKCFTGCMENLLECTEKLLECTVNLLECTVNLLECMAVASARIIRVHVLHGANSWSVKKNPRFLANQIAGILLYNVF